MMVIHVTVEQELILFFLYSIGHGTGYKSSELSSLTDGSTLAIGGKQIEV